MTPRQQLDRVMAQAVALARISGRDQHGDALWVQVSAEEYLSSHKYHNIVTDHNFRVHRFCPVCHNLLTVEELQTLVENAP